LLEKDWSLLSDNGIRGVDFFGDSEVVYLWIKSYEAKHKDFPTPAIVSEMTGISLPDVGTKAFALDNIRDSILGKRIKEKLQDAISHLQNGNTTGALAELRNLPEIQVKDRRSFRQDGDRRFKEYEHRKTVGVQGVSIPWPSLEALFFRWENGTFNSLLAPTNTGKSWACCVLAHHAMNKGEKVILVTMENSVESFERRLDALAYKIPFNDIRTGRADFRAERTWREQMQAEKDKPGDILLYGRQQIDSVADILQVVAVENPSFVVVDGGYKLSDSSTEGGHAETKKVIDSLHSAAAHTNLPWLVSSQLNPPTRATGSRELGYSARYGKEWIIDPATSIALMQDEDDLMLNRTKIIVLKMRDSGDTADKKTEFYIRSDREYMSFDEIPEDAGEIEIEF
jgi:KaiC/GvpD/RAD55 family RecA-like ATPase